VDELNRDKNGIRVKTLAETGYSSIADIYTATVNQLESIQGISYVAAKSIKQISDNIVKESYKTIKIKLNVDNKNILSSQIVLQIYEYKQKQDLIKEKNSILNIFKNDIEKVLNELNKIANGILYYFSEKDEKINYISTYNWVKNIIFGEDFGNKINNIIFKYKTIKELSNDEAWNDFTVNSIKYYNILEEICPGILGNDDTFYGLPEDLAREIQEECFFPDGLLCTLRNYQEWGVKYILHQGKVLLGDEMGLGKTIQAIATMVSLKNTGATHFMVICPASVVTNWCREIAKHSKLRPTMIYGRTRASAIESWLKTGGVAVTNYETTQHINFEEGFKFSLLVVDEAHYIKNPDANRTVQTKKICKHVERLLFMTGTALENKVEEMINLISFLRPQLSHELKSIAFMSSAPQFREKIASVYYRRKRNDVEANWNSPI
jgi:SNF2 family DNA or RNA helicase